MSRKHYRPEEIIAKLREPDVLMSQGGKIADVVATNGIHEGDLLPLEEGVRRDEGHPGEAACAN